MTGIEKYIIEGTICNFPETGSVALELSIQQAKEFVVGLLILNENFCDFLSVNDKPAKKTLVIKRHQNYKKAQVKGKLRTRSSIVRGDGTWMFFVTMCDLELIIDWYLNTIVSINSVKYTSRFNYSQAVLDIECEDGSVIMFATSLSLDTIETK